MINRATLQSYIDKVELELKDDILPFWMQHTVDRERGGFYGEVSNDLVIDREAPRGALLCARILWTYAAAYRRYQNPTYLTMADWAYEDLIQHFWDQQYDGLYWMIAADGTPIQARKQIYGQAFGIYALSEYAMATGKQAAQDYAIKLFQAIEKHSYDPQNQGYFEAYTREWQLADDMRLSDVDMNEKKSMNTHLHVMEAFTNLMRIWDDAQLKNKQTELLTVMMDRIINPATHHLLMFFDENWISKSGNISFGHDIEASWLLVESAEVLGDPDLIARAKSLSVAMAQATFEEGLDPDGGLLYEADATGIIDPLKHWWPQAEAAVGFLNAYQLSGKPHFLAASLQSWDFIERYMIDREYGEWFRYVTRNGEAGTDDPKVSFWKCPYHNGRACMEISARLKEMMA